MSVIHGIVIDCHDPHRVAAFWQQVLGYEVRQSTPDWVSLRPLHNASPYLSFDAVPERKNVKNRMHLDIRPVNRNQKEERERLESLGASTVRLVDENPDDIHYVMADPEGNEFCLLEAGHPRETNRSHDKT